MQDTGPDAVNLWLSKPELLVGQIYYVLFSSLCLPILSYWFFTLYCRPQVFVSMCCSNGSLYRNGKEIFQSQVWLIFWQNLICDRLLFRIDIFAMAETRTATVSRKTNETDIHVALNLDSQLDQKIDINTGIGFLDHVWWFRERKKRRSRTKISMGSCLDVPCTCKAWRVVIDTDVQGRSSHWRPPHGRRYRHRAWHRV